MCSIRLVCALQNTKPVPVEKTSASRRDERAATVNRQYITEKRMVSNPCAERSMHGYNLCGLNWCDRLRRGLNFDNPKNACTVSSAYTQTHSHAVHAYIRMCTPVLAWHMSTSDAMLSVSWIRVENDEISHRVWTKMKWRRERIKKMNKMK